MRSAEEITRRELTREEIAAMYVFNRDYALQTGGAIEFWGLLAPYRKRVVQELLRQLDKASNPVRVENPRGPGGKGAPHASER